MHNAKLSYEYKQCNYMYFHYRVCRRATSNNAKIEFRRCANARARGRCNLNADYSQVRCLETLGRCDWPTRENGRGRIIVASASVRLLGAATIMRFALGECINHSVELDDLGIHNSLLSSGTESIHFYVIALLLAIFRSSFD